MNQKPFSLFSDDLHLQKKSFIIHFGVTKVYYKAYPNPFQATCDIFINNLKLRIFYFFTVRSHSNERNIFLSAIVKSGF